MMKRFLILMALSLPLAACTPSTTNPATLAPGYLNATDQQMGEILAAAHAFYTSIQQQSAAGTMVLSATEKSAFNAFGVSLNAADSIYLAYHNGTTTEAQAQAAVNTVQSQQATLPLPAVTK